jgi:hypothetical protein
VVVKLIISGVIFANHLKMTVQSKWHRRCSSVSQTFLQKFLQHILGYNVCAEHHVLGHFYQMLLPLKASKIFCPKAKNGGEMNHMWCQFCQPFKGIKAK